MEGRPPRTLAQTEKLRWIREETKESQDRTYFDWANVRRTATRLAKHPLSDLRVEFEHAIKEALPGEVNYAFTLMTARWFGEERLDHDLFVEGAPLGPMETLQVYSSNLSGFDIPEPNVLKSFGPKSHAPFHCHHSDGIGPFDELISYGEFLPRYAEWRRWIETHGRPPTDDLCSFCGGATIRLLTDEQIDHYQRVAQKASARRATEDQAGVTRLRPRPL